MGDVGRPAQPPSDEAFASVKPQELKGHTKKARLEDADTI